MKYIHASLYYLASYLTVGGIALFFAPTLTLKLFQSNAYVEYGTVIPRVSGTLLFALGLLVIVIIRQRVESLYIPLVYVRLPILAAVVWLYFYSRDPLFITLFLIVGLGVALTLIGHYTDKSRGIS